MSVLDKLMRRPASSAPKPPKMVTIPETQLRDQERNLRTLQHLQTLAGARTLTLPVLVARAMHLDGYTVTAPKLDTRSRTWSIVDIIAADSNRVISVYVPIFDPSLQFVVIDHSAGETPRKKWFHTEPNGALGENTLLMVRGFADYISDALVDPSNGLDTVSTQLDDELKALLDEAAAGLPLNEAIDQVL